MSATVPARFSRSLAGHTQRVTAAPSSETDRLVGGRYRLCAPLGRGGSGVVWVAQDELLGREVAVKEFLLPTGVGVEDRATMLERVLREARAAARLHDPSLVTVFDVVREDEQPWIVMEYVHGRSLAELVREDGPLPPGRTADVGLALLHALRTAHAAGVLHRDVKPANVLLDDGGRVLLTDFGIASTVGDASLTSTGVLLGSPAYMAPERARGHKATPASDLWSLGATLYTLVEGEPPYAGENSLAVLMAVAENRRRPMQRADGLEPVLADLLDSPAEQRPDAVALGRRLREAAMQAALGEQPPADPAVTRPQRVGERTAVLAALAPAAAEVAPAAEVAHEPEAEAAPAPEAAAAPALPVVEPTLAPPAGRVGEPPAPSRAEPRRVEPRRVPPRPAGRPQEQERHRRRRAAALIGSGVGVAALVVAGVALLTSGSLSSSRQAVGSSPATSVPPAATAPTPSAAPTSAAPSSTPTASPSASAVAVPAGWQTYRNPRYGWTVAHPPNWSVGPGISSDQVDLRDPATSRLLRVEIGAQAHPSAIADWYSYEPVFAQKVQGYQRIKIAPSDGGNGTRSADWEFTFRSGSVTLHVLDRGVVDGKTAHALYWQTTDSDWAASQQQFQQLASSFVPPVQT